ncbi:zinc finger protein 32 isoform X14 [Rattus norvegicus]|uniref:zinc finger protein 32 isoform X14 n=1 Tax=Rattus norvegicus TaxID=10116 RepID=UPI002FD7B28F
MGIAAPTHMTALPSNQNQPAPGQRSWFLPRHRGDASHSASRHAQAPGSCGPATRSIAAAATGSTPALSVCGRAPLRYSSPAHGSIIRRGGDQSHRAGADMFGFPTATLLDCHGRYAQNVAFFNVMTEAHKYDSSEATGSSSWDFQSSFRREKLEQKSPDSKALQEDSPGVRQKEELPHQGELYSAWKNPHGRDTLPLWPMWKKFHSEREPGCAPTKLLTTAHSVSTLFKGSSSYKLRVQNPL